MKTFLHKHFAILLFNANSVVLLILVLMGKKYDTLPTFGFILLLDLLYALAQWRFPDQPAQGADHV